LDHFFIKALTNNENNDFYMYINTTEEDKILSVKYDLKNLK